MVHLAMKTNSNLNLFPFKGGMQDHYILHMLMSQRNQDHKKHLQVGFSAYVQESQVNHPKNTSNLRTLDGIYLFPATDLQGGHHIMDLRTGLLVTIPKVVNIPTIDVVTSSVEKMTEEQGFK